MKKYRGVIVTLAAAILASGAGVAVMATPAQAATVCQTAPNGAKYCYDNGAGGGTGSNTGVGGSSAGNGGAGSYGTVPPPPPRPVAPAPKVTPAPAPKVGNPVVTFSNVTSNSITVSWNKPAIVGTRGSYIVLVSQKLANPQGGVFVSRAEYSPLTNSVKLTHLKANSTYIVTVAASSFSGGKIAIGNTYKLVTTKR